METTEFTPYDVTTRQLNKCNAWVHTYPNGTQILLSYTIPVAAIDRKGYMYVLPCWDSSFATLKHVRLFLGMPAGGIRTSLRLGSIGFTNNLIGLITV